MGYRAFEIVARTRPSDYCSTLRDRDLLRHPVDRVRLDDEVHGLAALELELRDRPMCHSDVDRVAGVHAHHRDPITFFEGTDGPGNDVSGSIVMNYDKPSIIVAVLSITIRTITHRALCQVDARSKAPADFPRVLLIGDSISMGYTRPVQQLMTGRAVVSRNAGNVGPSRTQPDRLRRWLPAR